MNMSEGTITSRMIVASMITLAPSPSASILTTTLLERRNAKTRWP